MPAAERRESPADLAARWWPVGLIAIWLVIVIAPVVVAPQDPLALNLSTTLVPPSPQHFFGTDQAGRDLWARCVWGVRYSLGISILIVVGAAAIGTVIGGVAGLFRGPVDALLMRTTDVFLAFPYLILAIAIASAVGPGLTTVVVALTAVWWPGYARMVRGQVLALKELAFVEGARAAGTSTLMILFRHLLPHLLPNLSARVSMDVGYAVLALTATPRPVSSPAPVPLTIDTTAVFSGLGRSGKARGSVAQVSYMLVPDKVTLAGMGVTPALGYGSPVNIQMVATDRAVATGDFAITGAKVAPLLQALAGHGITATALHTHMIGESPTIYFIHFWADGALSDVVRGLKAAVDATK